MFGVWWRQERIGFGVAGVFEIVWRMRRRHRRPLPSSRGEASYYFAKMMMTLGLPLSLSGCRGVSDRLYWIQNGFNSGFGFGFGRALSQA